MKGPAGFSIAAIGAGLVALSACSGPPGPGTPGATVQAWPTLAEAARSSEGPDALVRRMRAHLEKQPRDARGWAVLARLEFGMDRFGEAAQAYEKALALSSRVANDPAVWCEYADALGMTQGGKLSGRPRALLDRALALNSRHPKALEMAGSAEYERGDYAAAARYWRMLLASLEPGSRANGELAAAVVRAERLALLDLPGPN